MFDEATKILEECNLLMDEEIAIKKKIVKSDADHLRLAEIYNRKHGIASHLNNITAVEPMKNYFN